MEMVEEGEPPTWRRGWGRTFLKLIALLVFVVAVAGAVYLYLFPDVRNRVLMGASPLLRGVPVLENLVGKETKSGGTALTSVRIKEVRQRSVANLLTGNLRVIEGVAVNQASYPLARIRVRLVIADAYDVAELKGQLLPALDAEGTLLVDAEHLTRLDTSVVQLFLYAARCVRALRVEVGSPAWVSAWATLGLSPSEQASTTE